MEIYHWYRNLLSKSFNKLAKIFAIIGVSLIISAYLPSFWYWLKTNGKDTVSGFLLQTITKLQPVVEVREPVEIYQPRYDPKLPGENRLKIAAIGVSTPIYEATLDNYEKALKKGVWRIADFGSPFSRAKPTILAAHRYGYLAWSIPYRLKNSFYNLPKLKVGETVEIIWRQRKYTYEIYAESKGEEVEDYSASLILYTCESLNSPARIFKYARLLEI
jgi:sortase (surface protein transpeptidase)